MKVNQVMLILILAFYVSCDKNIETYKYPISKIDKIEEEFFGRNISDPYRWLEDSSNNDVVNWVNAQDSLLKNILHKMPERKGLKKRIEDLTSYDLFLSPQRVLDKTFYLSIPKGKSRAIIMEQDSEMMSKVLFDTPTEFMTDSLGLQTTGGYSGYFISPQGSKMIYTIAHISSRWFSVKTRDLITGKDFNEELNGFHLVGGDIYWDAKGEGFYYVKFSTSNTSKFDTPENASLFYHKVGTSQQGDKLIYKIKEEGNWLYNLYPTEDGQYLLIEGRDGSKVNNRIFYKNLTSNEPVKELLTSYKASYTFLGNDGETFYLYSNYNAPNGKIISLNITTKRVHDVIPEIELSISAGSQVGGNAIGMFSNRLLITYTKDGRPMVKCFNNRGEFLYDVNLPLDGSIWGGFQGNTIDNEVFYRFLALTQPSTIFKLDIESSKTEILKKSEVGFNDSQFITKQVFYTSKDGTRIPMFITHKKGIKLDGSNPAFIYAYGAFNWISFLWYQPHLLSWLEMGGVYAQPSIRGGGEYGEEWHQDGVGLNRQNAVDDYISASEWLIEQGYVSNKRLVANGGSISSALAGNVLTQRPDLYGAVIIDRPALDMLRYDRFTTASFWVDELGSPKDSLDFEVLYGLSPYHQLDNNAEYPPVLVMIGNKDEVTPPLHAYKFIAALQNVGVAKTNPMLLKMMWDTGHTFGSSPEQVVDSRTDEILFLIKALRIESQY